MGQAGAVLFIGRLEVGFSRTERNASQHMERDKE
jgi:hypothetical protein